MYRPSIQLDAPVGAHDQSSVELFASRITPKTPCTRCKQVTDRIYIRLETEEEGDPESQHEYYICTCGHSWTIYLEVPVDETN